MPTKGKVDIEIRADDKASAKMERIGNSANSMSGKFKKAGKIVAGVGAAMAAAIVAMGVASVKTFADAGDSVWLMATAAADLFPRLVPALGAPELSLTAANASSSELTLKTMLVLAVIGMPLVIGYTIWVYRAFRGKIDPDAEMGHY